MSLEKLIAPADPGSSIGIRWGVVTGLDPLRVRLDGDTIEVPATPTSLSRHRLGQRVLVLINNHRLIILGVLGGENDFGTVSLHDSNVGGSASIISLTAGVGSMLVVETHAALIGAVNDPVYANFRAYSNGDWTLGQEADGNATRGRLYFTHSTNRINFYGGGTSPGVPCRFHNTVELWDPPTSTFTANVGIASNPKDRLYKLSSARRFKADIEDVPEDVVNKILNLKPRTWFDRAQVVERIGEDALEGEENDLHLRPDVRERVESARDLAKQRRERIRLRRRTTTTEPKPEPEPEPEEALPRILGLVAEEVEEAGLDEFVSYSTDPETGERVVDGVSDRMWVLYGPIIKKLATRVEQLEARVEQLEQRLVRGR